MQKNLEAQLQHAVSMLSHKLHLQEEPIQKQDSETSQIISLNQSLQIVQNSIFAAVCW